MSFRFGTPSTSMVQIASPAASQANGPTGGVGRVSREHPDRQAGIGTPSAEAMPTPLPSSPRPIWSGPLGWGPSRARSSADARASRLTSPGWPAHGMSSASSQRSSATSPMWCWCSGGSKGAVEAAVSRSIHRWERCGISVAGRSGACAPTSITPRRAKWRAWQGRRGRRASRSCGRSRRRRCAGDDPHMPRS